MSSSDGATGTGRPSVGPEDSPGFLLWRTTLRWQRVIAGALRPLELTHVQFVLLATIWWLSEQAQSPQQLPSQRQVAAHAEADVMMTSQVVRVLEGRALISRASDPADARIKRLTITDSGRRVAEQAIAIVESADAEFFARVRNPRELLNVLHQLADNPHVIS